MLLPTLERCLDGICTRRDHAFADEDATRKMHTEFERADVDDRHLLTDPPPGDPIATADRVLAARADGRLAYDRGRRL